jgi:hypothetical protein
MMGECECGETVMSGVVSICKVTADQTLCFCSVGTRSRTG